MTSRLVSTNTRHRSSRVGRVCLQPFAKLLTMTVRFNDQQVL